jgi:hypothetical protein
MVAPLVLHLCGAGVAVMALQLEQHSGSGVRQPREGSELAPPMTLLLVVAV